MNLDFLENFKIRSRKERLLWILTYLHTGPRTRADIADHFGISERTLNEDLKTLEDGFDFLSYQMKIEMERGKNTYTSKIHPIFLAMRTDEIFSLTVGLKLISRGTVFEGSLGHVADMVYQQLSPYAREIVDQHTENFGLSYTKAEMQFVNSYDIVRKESLTNLAYYLKEQIPCKIVYKDGSLTKEIVGIPLLHDDGNRRWDQIRIQREDGDIIISISDVIDIRR